MAILEPSVKSYVLCKKKKKTKKMKKKKIQKKKNISKKILQTQFICIGLTLTLTLSNKFR